MQPTFLLALTALWCAATTPPFLKRPIERWSACFDRGKLETIYKRWFENYADADHRSLQMPMTAELRSSMENAITD